MITRKIEMNKCFHACKLQQGFNEFYDKKTGTDAVVYGREWTLPDVRRKVSGSILLTRLSLPSTLCEAVGIH